MSFLRPIRSRAARTAVLVAFLAVSVWDLYPVGARQWAVPPEPDDHERSCLRISEALAESLRTPRHNRYWTISLDSGFNVGYVPYWYLERYIAFHQRAFDIKDLHAISDAGEAKAFQEIMGMVDGRRIFLSKSLDHSSIAAFGADARETTALRKPGITIEQYDGDRLVINVTLSEATYLSFIDNWDTGWQATVNGKPVQIHKLFGAFKSVSLPPGASRVVFEYRPFTGGP